MQEDLATSVIDLLEKRKIRINMISKEEKDKIITSIGTEEGKPHLLVIMEFFANLSDI